MGRPSIPLLSLTCEACGKVYEKRPSDRRKRDYCSQACYHANKSIHRPPRTVLNFKCENCGIDVTRFKGHETPHVFCSRDCYWKSDFHAETVAAANAARNHSALETEPCGNCGKSVSRYASSRGKALFCDRNCHNAFRRARQTRRITDHGYVIMFVGRDYPGATKAGQVMEHRKIMQDILGRPLVKDENVHHINGVRTDNCPENLELWSHSQPKGQRVADKIQWAKDFLALYERDCETDNEPIPK